VTDCGFELGFSHAGQGYYVSRPLAASAALQLMRRSFPVGERPAA
jgi:hypothetical protein